MLSVCVCLSVCALSLDVNKGSALFSALLSVQSRQTYTVVVFVGHESNARTVLFWVATASFQIRTFSLFYIIFPCYSQLNDRRTDLMTQCLPWKVGNYLCGYETWMFVTVFTKLPLLCIVCQLNPARIFMRSCSSIPIRVLGCCITLVVVHSL